MRRVLDDSNVLLKARILKMSDGSFQRSTGSNLSLTITEPDGVTKTNTIPLQDTGQYRGVIGLSKIGVNKVEANTTIGSRNVSSSTQIRVVETEPSRRVVKEPGDNVYVEIKPHDLDTAENFDNAKMTIIDPVGTKVVNGAQMRGRNGEFAQRWESSESAETGVYQVLVELEDSITNNWITVGRTFRFRDSNSH